MPPVPLWGGPKESGSALEKPPGAGPGTGTRQDRSATPPHLIRIAFVVVRFASTSTAWLDEGTFFPDTSTR